MPYLSLLGGEPFLHPGLADLVSLFRRVCPETSLQILTGGIFKSTSLDGLSPADLGLIFNVNEPGDYKEPSLFDMVIANVEHAIQRGFRVILGFNVWRMDFNTGFMPELASRLGRSNFRWTVANPQWSNPASVVAPEHYGSLVKKCVEMLKKAARLKIEAMLDCPLPLCFFGEPELAWVRQYHSGTASRMGICQPVIDVTPELDAIRCFALSKTTRVNLLDYPSEWALSEWFRKHVDAEFLSSGCFAFCSNCQHFLSGKCTGGCLAWHRCSFEGGAESPSSKLARAMYSEIEAGRNMAALNLFEEAGHWIKSDLSYYLAAVASKQGGKFGLAFKYASLAQDMTSDEDIKQRVTILFRGLNHLDITKENPEPVDSVSFVNLPSE